MITVRPEADLEGFAPFGRVFMPDPRVSRPVNEGRGRRLDLPLPLDHDTQARQPTLALYAIKPSALPLTLACLECHPHSEQMFLALGETRGLIACAPSLADGAPDFGRIRAFVTPPGLGIVYAKGVWHMPLAALEREGQFLMAQWENRNSRDCLVQLPFESVIITTR